MKTFIIIIHFLATTNIPIAQFPFELQTHPIEISKRKIKKELIKSLVHEKSMTKIAALCQMMKLKIIPIHSLIIDPRAIEYDSTKKITQYLKSNDIFSFEYAILFKNKSLHSMLDCSDIVNYVRCEICNYNDSIEAKINHPKYEIARFLNNINIQKKTFLFTVQFFKNAIWFVEKKEVKVYCTEHKIVYDPDEFIAKHYSIETVRDLAQGKLGSF